MKLFLEGLRGCTYKMEIQYHFQKMVLRMFLFWKAPVQIQVWTTFWALEIAFSI